MHARLLLGLLLLLGLYKQVLTAYKSCTSFVPALLRAMHACQSMMTHWVSQTVEQADLLTHQHPKQLIVTKTSKEQEHVYMGYYSEPHRGQ